MKNFLSILTLLVCFGAGAAIQNVTPNQLSTNTGANLQAAFDVLAAPNLNNLQNSTRSEMNTASNAILAKVLTNGADATLSSLSANIVSGHTNYVDYIEGTNNSQFQIYGGGVHLTLTSGTVNADSGGFSGSGVNLSSLNASSLSSGTVPKARAGPLTNHTDVTVTGTAPTPGQILIWSGTAWTNGPQTGTGGGVSVAAGTNGITAITNGPIVSIGLGNVGVLNSEQNYLTNVTFPALAPSTLLGITAGNGLSNVWVGSGLSLIGGTNLTATAGSGGTGISTNSGTGTNNILTGPTIVSGTNVTDTRITSPGFSTVGLTNFGGALYVGSGASKADVIAGAFWGDASHLTGVVGPFVSTTNGIGTNATFYSTGGNPAIQTIGGNTNFFGGVNNMATNAAPIFSITNAIVLGTRYSNGSQRAFVTASFTLNGAAAGTAIVTLYVEGNVTNKLTISSGPLASLTVADTLSALVEPNEVYYFADESSGTGASVAFVANTFTRKLW